MDRGTHVNVTLVVLCIQMNDRNGVAFRAVRSLHTTTTTTITTVLCAFFCSLQLFESTGDMFGPVWSNETLTKRKTTKIGFCTDTPSPSASFLLAVAFVGFRVQQSPPTPTRQTIWISLMVLRVGHRQTSSIRMTKRVGQSVLH